MPAAAVIVSGVVSAGISASATRSASGDISRSTANALEESRRQFDVAREDLAPYVKTGTEALDKLKRVFIEGDEEAFTTSFDFKFLQEQGEQGLQRKLAGEGASFGGRALKEAARFNTGLASGELNNFFSRLFNIASTGQAAASQTANQAVAQGQTNAGLIQNEGLTQGNISLQQGQNLNQAVQGTLSNLTTLQTYNDLLKNTNFSNLGASITG